MKTLYIFDMGGVLCCDFNNIPVISAYLGITEENFFVCAGENFRELLNGKINSNEFWVRFSLRYGKKVKEELFGKFFNPGIIQRTKNIIEELRNNSRVVCGTNTIDSHYYYLLNQGSYDIFDEVYASNLMGISKPDPDFYWHILRKEGIKPENTVFVDDIEENIISAQKIGINSILFTDADSLKRQIKTLSLYE
ncbi:MAG: HAD-IA family hydrolase [Actinobacteria bacterium]|nr:HAD-IA family hydrolase [Candidatus Atribacteria bacterium]MBE3113570.1 HAD-IA family hydrolase [Actinomycetota bacterium]MBE3127525.1 HAD-IA family hydrolase [Candidatus Atribacteria bacterium]